MKSYLAIPLTLLLTATILYLTFSNSLLAAITLSGISAFLLSPIGIYSVIAVAVAFCFWNMQSYKRPINEERLIAKISEMIKEKGLSSQDIDSSSKALHGNKNESPEGMLKKEKGDSSEDIKSSSDTLAEMKKELFKDQRLK